MIDYNKIIQKYDTPLFIYDIDELQRRVNYLKSKFNNNYNMVYAVKANTFVIKEIDSLVERFEICSPGEYEICEKLKIDRNKMVISGVNKDKHFIDYLISNFDDILKYTIESYNQYVLLNELSTKYKKKIHVLIRLSSGNQFGVSEEDFIKIIQENNNLIIDGIEYFSGTQKHSLTIIEKELDHLNDFINEIENNYNFKIEEVEYGPGLPVFYFQGNEFNEDNYLEELNKIIGKFGEKVISLEIGRSMVASSGTYLTKVVDLKENKNGNFVILDGGINHLVYYGQTMAMKIPYYEVMPKRESEEITYNLCGSLCTTNDYLVKNIKLNKLMLNDTFIFKNTGAYSSTEGIALFLSRDLPKIILVKDGKELLIRDSVKSSLINYPNYDMEEVWKN